MGVDEKDIFVKQKTCLVEECVRDVMCWSEVHYWIT